MKRTLLLCFARTRISAAPQREEEELGNEKEDLQRLTNAKTSKVRKVSNCTVQKHSCRQFPRNPMSKKWRRASKQPGEDWV